MTWLLCKAALKIIAVSYLEIYGELDCKNMGDKSGICHLKTV